MGGIEEEAWFFDELRTGRTGEKAIVCHTIVFGTACLTRGA